MKMFIKKYFSSSIVVLLSLFVRVTPLEPKEFKLKAYPSDNRTVIRNETFTLSGLIEALPGVKEFPRTFMWQVVDYKRRPDSSPDTLRFNNECEAFPAYAFDKFKMDTRVFGVSCSRSLRSESAWAAGRRRGWMNLTLKTDTWFNDGRPHFHMNVNADSIVVAVTIVDPVASVTMDASMKNGAMVYENGTVEVTCDTVCSNTQPYIRWFVKHVEYTDASALSSSCSPDVNGFPRYKTSSTVYLNGSDFNGEIPVKCETGANIGKSFISTQRSKQITFQFFGSGDVIPSPSTAGLSAGLVIGILFLVILIIVLAFLVYRFLTYHRSQEDGTCWTHFIDWKWLSCCKTAPSTGANWRTRFVALWPCWKKGSSADEAAPAGGVDKADKDNADPTELKVMMDDKENGVEPLPPNAFENQRNWYYTTDCTQKLDILKDANTSAPAPVGTFFIHQENEMNKLYVKTNEDEKEPVKSFEIVQDKSKWRLKNDECSFNELIDLVQHYRSNPLPTTDQKLVQPFETLPPQTIV
ncbi:uncharacterized protein LOC141911924 [Tubulanus polymorphus]|uniref:uncharacterized protein LOC141911924 n=1 Tax=Tubulanus polymorphus TaxID=672921 RepID=UPI003DA3FE08